MCVTLDFFTARGLMIVLFWCIGWFVVVVGLFWMWFNCVALLAGGCYAGVLLIVAGYLCCVVRLDVNSVVIVCIWFMYDCCFVVVV